MSSCCHELNMENMNACIKEFEDTIKTNRKISKAFFTQLSEAGWHLPTNFY